MRIIGRSLDYLIVNGNHCIRLLAIMSRKRILCVGMCVLDIIHVCGEYPKEDSDQRCLDGYWQRGGNASNSCTVLRQLGAEAVEFLGMISENPAFKFLYNDCHKRGIYMENCPLTPILPPHSSVILAKNTGSRTIIHTNSGFPTLRHEHFAQLNFKLYQWIHFEGRNCLETKRMLHQIRNHNGTKRNSNRRITISLELEKIDKSLLVLAVWVDVLFIGKDMAEHMGWHNARDAVYGLRKFLYDMQQTEKHKTPSTDNNSMSEAPGPTIICPWGSKTSDYLTAAYEYGSIPAENIINIVDTLGAGDTFVASVIYAMAIKKLSTKASVEFANRVAAFKIQHRGYDDIAGYKF